MPRSSYMKSVSIKAFALMFFLFLGGAQLVQWISSKSCVLSCQEHAQMQKTNTHLDEVSPRNTVQLMHCRQQDLDNSIARITELKRTKLLKTIIVDDKNKVLFCYVPKVASGNWKRIFLVLSGKYDWDSPIETTVAHKETLLKNLGDYSPNDILDKIKNYRSFTVVREPMERLLSAYINKIHFDYTGKFQRLFGKKMLKYTKQKDYVGGGKWNVTFEEFVDFLTTETEREAFEIHWERIHNICHPCLLKYSYIGRYENLSHDAPAIIKMAAPNTELTFPHYVMRSSTKQRMIEYFKKITPTQFRKLVQLYKQDYLLFGYSMPEYLFEVVQRSIKLRRDLN